MTKINNGCMIYPSSKSTKRWPRKLIQKTHRLVGGRDWYEGVNFWYVPVAKTNYLRSRIHISKSISERTHHYVHYRNRFHRKPFRNVLVLDRCPVQKGAKSARMGESRLRCMLRVLICTRTWWGSRSSLREALQTRKTHPLTNHRRNYVLCFPDRGDLRPLCCSPARRIRHTGGRCGKRVTPFCHLYQVHQLRLMDLKR